MLPPQPDWPKTLEGFRAWHERQPDVWEFIHGVPKLMAPGSMAHTLIKSNMHAALAQAVQGTGCRALVDGASSVPQVADAVALASLLASSAHVHDCFVRQVYRFTSGSRESDAELDALSAETKAFEAHDLNVAELMLSLTANLTALPRSPARAEP